MSVDEERWALVRSQRVSQPLDRPNDQSRGNQNQKYDKIKKYGDNQSDGDNKKYDFGIDIGIDKELMTIDRLKIDVGTKFKGIN